MSKINLMTKKEGKLGNEKKNNILDLKKIYHKQNSMDLFINKIKSTNSDRENLFGNFENVQKEEILENTKNLKNDNKTEFEYKRQNQKKFTFGKNHDLKKKKEDIKKIIDKIEIMDESENKDDLQFNLDSYLNDLHTEEDK